MAESGRQTLNHRIVIEQRGAARDASGQPVEAWETVAELWADVRHPSGLASIRAGADVSIVKASVRIRWRYGLNAGMRVAYAGRYYDIKAVLPDGGLQYIDLVCEVVQ